jgi:hypothetical protein
LIENFASEANNSQARITLKWISGHSGVRGNERADDLAKEAAAGRASGRADLPRILQRTLPASASAVKQEYMRHLRDMWTLDWTTSPRRERMERMDDNFPFDSYRKRQYGLSRTHASLLLQVRSGHLPLNPYLHRIGKSETKRCLSCSDAQGGNAPAESTKHFIYDCRAYATQREKMIKDIGATNLAIKDIMLEPKRMRALAWYMVATRRFTRKEPAP